MEKLTEIQFNKLSPSDQDALIDKFMHTHDHNIKIGSYIIDREGLKYEVRDIKDISEGDEIDFMLTLVDHYYTNHDGSEKLVTKKSSYLFSSGYSERSSYWGYAVWNGTLDELQSDAKDFMINGSSEELEAHQENQEEGLMNFDKSTFITLKKNLITKTNHFRSKMMMANVIMQQKMRELKNKLEPMMKEVKRLKKIIWTIELYLGIQENIQHLQSGEESSLEEPINLMQEMLYMDEEVGDPTNDGLDFRNIEDFYDWMFVFNDYFGYENYKLLLPYNKCVRLMKVRRHEKAYDCPWTKMQMDELNDSTFILIRNGENVYCIDTNMKFGDKLFPFETELMDLQNSIIESNKGYHRLNGRLMDDEYLQEIVDEKMKSATDLYKRNFIVMQGLIDRTEVFGKLFGIVNLMNGTAMKRGQVVFNYDADQTNVIGDGDVNFIDKMEDVLKDTGAGSRILFLNDRESSDPEYEFFKLPFTWKRRTRWDYPSRPKKGLYDLLEDVKEEYYGSVDEKKKVIRKTLFFKYLPDGEIWDDSIGNYGDYRPRKKRVSFAPYMSIDNTIDVDQFSHRDIDWLNKMFYDRRQRKQYNYYMSGLIALRNFKTKELEEELPFAELIMGKFNIDLLEARDMIHWWKTKNKYKRALTIDDAKAYRMIEKELKKKYS